MMRALGVHSFSTKGPLPTKLAGVSHGVERSFRPPRRARTRGFTGYQAQLAAKSGRYGVGRSSVITIVRASGAARPSAAGSLILPALKASPFRMGKRKYA